MTGARNGYQHLRCSSRNVVFFHYSISEDELAGSIHFVSCQKNGRAGTLYHFIPNPTVELRAIRSWNVLWEKSQEQSLPGLDRCDEVRRFVGAENSRPANAESVTGYQVVTAQYQFPANSAC